MFLVLFLLNFDETIYFLEIVLYGFYDLNTPR